MKYRMKLVLFLLGAVVIFCFLRASAEAAVSLTAVQTSSAELVMGTRAVTYRITNTSNAGEVLNRVRFNLANNTYTSYPNPETFIAPTGWTCTRSSNTRIQCSATAGYEIPTTAGANYRDFTFNIKNVVTTYDTINQLSTVQGRRLGSNTYYTATLTSSWTWKALEMTLVPAPTNIGTGCTTTVTMTVTNRSSVNNLVITSIPSARPTAVTTGGAAINSPAAVPASLTLNAGISGFITWTYTLTGPAGGTVKFTACASTGASCNTTSGSTRTSSSVTTGLVTIIAGASCSLASAMTITPTCLYSGNITTVQMMVTNTTGTTVINVTPVVTACTGPAQIGSPACTWLTGPSPASIANLLTNTTGTFTWTAAVTGNPNDVYSVSGYAKANGPITTPTVTSNVQDVDGYIVTVTSKSTGSAATNADSVNEELDWTITSYACSNINTVSIAIPAGWTYANDGYALVTNTTGTQVETWNPPAGATFTSPNATDRIPSGGNSGDFYLVFSQTPSATGNYNFDVTITDDVGVVRVKPSTVTVNPFNTGVWNATGTGVWQETIQ